MTLRMKRVDDGHFLVPGSDYELVCDYDHAGLKGAWSVYLGSEKVKSCPSYFAAREWALPG